MKEGRLHRVRPRPVRVLEDGRGRLVKAFPPEVVRAAASAGGEVYFVTFAPGAVRGGHYHETAREWFVPVQGRVRCELADPETFGRVGLFLDAVRPEILEVPPGIAHRFRALTEGAVLLAFTDRFHDPGKGDTRAFDFQGD